MAAREGGEGQDREGERPETWIERNTQRDLVIEKHMVLLA